MSFVSYFLLQILRSRGNIWRSLFLVLKLISSQLSMVAYLYTPRTWKVETRAAGVQGQPRLQNKFKASLKVDMQKLELNSPSLSPLGSTIECHFEICL